MADATGPIGNGGDKYHKDEENQDESSSESDGEEFSSYDSSESRALPPGPADEVVLSRQPFGVDSSRLGDGSFTQQTRKSGNGGTDDAREKIKSMFGARNYLTGVMQKSTRSNVSEKSMGVSSVFPPDDVSNESGFQSSWHSSVVSLSRRVKNFGDGNEGDHCCRGRATQMIFVVVVVLLTCLAAAFWDRSSSQVVPSAAPSMTPTVAP